MQVFKCFFKIVRHNKGSIIMYLAIFMVLVIAFSAIGEDTFSGTFTDEKIAMTVIDRDASEASRAVTELLKEHHNVKDYEDDADILRDALYNRSVEYILFIPAGYGEALATGGEAGLQSSKVPNSYSGEYVDGFLENYVATVKVYMDADFTIDEALEKAEADMALQSKVTLTHAETKNTPSSYYFYHYLSYVIMLMMIFGICPVLMVFSKKDLAMRMNSSALPLSRRNLGIGLGSMVLSVIFFAILMILGFIMYGGDMLINGSPICILNTACFMLVSAAMAFFVGQVSSSGNMLSALSNVIGLGLSFLGGVFVPLEFMGATMQKVAMFTPTYWYINVLDISTKGAVVSAQGMAEIWQSMGMQAIFGLAFLAAGLGVSSQKRKPGGSYRTSLRRASAPRPGQS